MSYPSTRPQTLDGYLRQQSSLLSQRITAFTLRDVSGGNSASFAQKLVDGVLPNQIVYVNARKTNPLPNQDVHYSKLPSPTNVGLNMRDVIEKTWDLSGPQVILDFMPSRLNDAVRNQNRYTIELILAVGELNNQEILRSKKEQLESIDKSINDTVANLNRVISENREAWLTETTRQVTEKYEVLLEASAKQKKADDFLNS